MTNDELPAFLDAEYAKIRAAGKPAGPPLEIDGKRTGSTWVDPDTIKIGGTESARLKGFNAPERGKIVGGVYIPGEISDDQTQQNVSDVIRAGGYTQGDRDGKDAHKRTLLDIQNKDKTSLGDTLTETGVAPINAFSSLEAIKNKNMAQAADRMLPTNPKTADPLRQIAAREQAAQYIPKVNVADPAAYASIKRNTGASAAIKGAEEVSRLEGLLARRDLPQRVRDNLTKNLADARQNIFLAGTMPDIVGGVNVQPHDRSVMNVAKNQFSTMLTNASLDVLKGIGGVSEMASEAAGWDGLAARSKNYSEAIKGEQDGLAETLSSFSQIPGRTNWQTVKNTGLYVTNLLAGMLPSVAILVASGGAAGAVGLAGVAGFAASAAAPSLIYAGQFFAEQDDKQKNPALALAMGITSGVLDRLGLSVIMSGGTVNTLVGRNLILDAMRKSKKYATETEMMSVLDNMTKKEIVSLAASGEKFAKMQVGTSQSMALSMKSLAEAVGSESITETLQQGAQMIAEKGQWNMDAQYEKDFYDQLLEAAVGGGVMAGVMRAPGGIRDKMQWKGIADGYKPYEGKPKENQMFQSDNQSELASGRGHENTRAMVESMASAPVDGSTSGYELTGMDSKRGVVHGLKAVFTDPVSLLRQLGDTIVPSMFTKEGAVRKNMGYLRAIIFGGSLPGDNASGVKQRLMGRFSGYSAESLAQRLSTNPKKADNLVREAWQNYWAKGLTLPQTSIQNTELQNWKAGVDDIRTAMLEESARAGIPLDSILNDHALFESSDIHPETLQAHRAAVENKMVNTPDAAGHVATQREANEAIKAIMSGNVAAASQARQFMSDHGVFKDPALGHVFESNVFTGIENLKERVSRDIMHKVYLGKNGEILGRLLQQAKAAGEFETDAQYDQAVTDTKAWYEIMTGQYHPLDEHPNLKKILGWGVTATMLSALGKAGLSSMAEVGMSTLGTEGHNTGKQLGSFFNNFWKEYKADINKFSSWSTSNTLISAMRKTPSETLRSKVQALEDEMYGTNIVTVDRMNQIAAELVRLHDKNFAYTAFERLGYAETGYNTQTRFEYADTNMKKTMHVFTSIIGLRAQTDAVRLAALSIAADTIAGKLTNLSNIPKADRQAAFTAGKGLSVSQAHDLADLQSFGMNVFFMVDAFNDPQSQMFQPGFLADIGLGVGEDKKNNPQSAHYKEVQENLLTTLGNFVDSKVVNPQAHNLPKFFHDPRLRVVTAMGRFMAAAHAVLLPKLYRKFILEGSSAMRYQAFESIVLTLLFASLANMLKDQLAYGEDSPYVRGAKAKMQRNLGSSGLTGQFEKVIDKVSPIYKGSGASITNDPVGWAGNQAAQASPVLSWAGKVAGGVQDVGSGNTDKGVYQLMRAAPLIGSFPIASREVANLFKGN